MGKLRGGRGPEPQHQLARRVERVLQRRQPLQDAVLVDHDESLRMLCRVNLELEGYRVLEAPTIETAQGLLRDEPVDVVLLDVHVGTGSGFTLLREIRDERVALFTGSFEVDKQRAATVDA